MSNIPNDLVVLDMEPDGPDDADKLNRVVMYADWYESVDAPGFILVSAHAIHYLSDTSPGDCGISLLPGKVQKVSEALKRPWDANLGWYHA